MNIKHYITKDENIKSLFISIKGRIGKGSYKKRKLLISWDDFYNFVFKDKQYNRIYKEWVKHDFWYSLSPSIDRINNDGDYTLDNIQALTRSQNSIKGQGITAIKEQKEAKIHLIEKRDELILILKSQGYSNIQISNIFNLNRSTVKRINDYYYNLLQDRKYKQLSKDLKRNVIRS